MSFSDLPKIPGYRVSRIINKGGTAVVYQGISKSGQSVAIKALDTSRLKDDFIARKFREEANHYLLLSHPNIPKLVDLIADGDRMYLVMEFVDGLDLNEYLKRYGILDNDMIVHVFSSLLETIGDLHRKGILHLDIKPGNIMITPDRQVKVLDLGISSTQMGEQLSKKCGSPSFMAPEQVRCEKLEPYTDVYQIGATLYNTLTGRPPFTGASKREIFDNICNLPVPQLVGVENEYCEHLQAFLNKAMHKEGAQRYQSCDEMLTALLECFVVIEEAGEDKDAEFNNNKVNINNHNNSFEMKVITVGREVGNDIVINDTKVSRHHLELIQDEAQNYFVRDLGSTNGTFVNGHRITGEMPIDTLDVIRIGNTTLPWISYFSAPSRTEYSEQTSNEPASVAPSLGCGAKLKGLMSGAGKWLGRTLLALLSSLIMILMLYFIMNYLGLRR